LERNTEAAPRVEIFGAGKLPEIGNALGKGIRNFKKATREPDEIDVTPQNKKVEPK
jgi:sec-independent protein translocase protein TatA